MWCLGGFWWFWRWVFTGALGVKRTGGGYLVTERGLRLGELRVGLEGTGRMINGTRREIFSGVRERII